MHQKCFAAWGLRRRFITTFNDYCQKHLRGMRFMRENGEIEEREPRKGDAV